MGGGVFAWHASTVAGMTKANARGSGAVAAALPDPVDWLVEVLDVTLLEADVSPAQLEELVVSAVEPGAGLPSAAAVCVLPGHVRRVRGLLGSSPVRLAAVAGAFPHGLASLAGQVADVAATVELGADEVDVVLDRFALRYDPSAAAAQVAALVAAAAGRPVKVIVESGQLTLPEVSLAARLACDAGAAFVKTSTGFTSSGASRDAVAAIASVIADGEFTSVGVKVSGGVRTVADARVFADVAASRLGRGVSPDWFRVGSSGLLQACVATASGSRPAATTGY